MQVEKFKNLQSVSTEDGIWDTETRRRIGRSTHALQKLSKELRENNLIRNREKNSAVSLKSPSQEMRCLCHECSKINSNVT